MSHSGPAEWPVDPDVVAGQPALDASRLAAVVAGGFVGGLVRYEVVDHWTTRPDAFPWPAFVVNTAGAFVLGVLVIVVLDVLAGSRYLRPMIGAGFCGALTTFGSLAVSVDQLLRHGHVAVGLGYLFASLAAGVLAAGLGAVVARLLPPTPTRRRSQAGG
ncbi:MAG TPA: CrcB family protein [Mycobacteriales bacterium]|nr:CrcB family protein [Mycobacteriales bacterium]